MTQPKLDEIETWPLERVKEQYELELTEHRRLIDNDPMIDGPLTGSRESYHTQQPDATLSAWLHAMATEWLTATNANVHLAECPRYQSTQIEGAGAMTTKVPSREFKTAEAAREFEKRKIAKGYETLFVPHGRGRVTVKYWKSDFREIRL